MSDARESSGSSPARRPRVGRLTVGCLVMVPIFFLLMMAGIGPGALALVLTLPFGWMMFLADTLPKISWDWGAIGAGILCTGLILSMGHGFLGWLSRSIASARGTTFSWPWRWTWCGLVGISLCFLVGMAVAGAAHQIAWIAGSDESLFESQPRKFEHYFEMSHVASIARECLKDTSTVDSLREDMTRRLKGLENRSSWLPSGLQSLHLLMLVGPNASVEGILIFPRDVEAQKKFGGEYVGPKDERPVPADQVRRFIEQNESRLVAF